MRAKPLRRVAFVVDDVGEPAGIALDHHQGHVDARAQLVEFGGELLDRHLARLAGHDHAGVPGSVAMGRVGSAVSGEVKHQPLARRERPADDIEPGPNVGGARRSDQPRQPDLVVANIGVGVVVEDQTERASQALIVALGQPILDRVPRAPVPEINIMPRAPQSDAVQNPSKVFDVFFQRNLIMRRRPPAKRQHQRLRRGRRAPSPRERQDQSKR